MKKRVLKEGNSQTGGVSIDLISTERLEELEEDKIMFILDQVKMGKVLVLEKGLTPTEELELIRVTMNVIDNDSFIGVETPGFAGIMRRRTLLQRLLGRTPPPRMMVVGPAHLLKTIRKDGRTIEALILTKEEAFDVDEEMEHLSEEVEGSRDEEDVAGEGEGSRDVEDVSDEAEYQNGNDVAREEEPAVTEPSLEEPGLARSIVEGDEE